MFEIIVLAWLFLLTPVAISAAMKKGVDKSDYEGMRAEISRIEHQMPDDWEIVQKYMEYLERNPSAIEPIIKAINHWQIQGGRIGGEK